MSKSKAKGRIPKRIAGVKVPKAVRKGRFGELLASKTGQAVIAQAILGAGAIATGLKAKDNPKVRGAAAQGKHGVEGAGHAAGEAGSAMAYAFAEAAKTFVQVLRQGETRTFAEPEAERWTADYGAPEPEGRRKPGQPLQPSRS